MTHYRKIPTVMVLLIVALSSFVYGNERIEMCERNDSCFSCSPNCCGSGFVFADLLYWRAFESGLDTCFPVSACDEINSDGRVISNFKGKGRNPNFEWNPGFRVGVGYEFYACNWDIVATWTHFHSHAHYKGNYSQNKLGLHLDFNTVDVLGGYRLNLSPCFILWPFIGLRGAEIEQKLHIGGSSYSISRYETNSLNQSDSISKQKFYGIGPMIGLGADWSIGCNFSIYADLSVSWLYGRNNVRFNELTYSTAGTNYCRTKNHLQACLAAADAGLGIQWQQCICRNIDLILELGLEHHRYFDFNRMGDCGDLCFDGVHFAVGFEF